MSDSNPIIKLADKIKKLKNGIKLHTYQDLGEEKDKMPETSAAEKDGKVIASFDKKGDEVISSSATADAQLNGAYEDSAKAAGYKKDDLVYTVPTLRGAQAAVTEDDSDANEVESAKLTKADGDVPKEKKDYSTLDYSKMKESTYKPWHWKEKLAAQARNKAQSKPSPAPSAPATPPAPAEALKPSPPPAAPTTPKPKYKLGSKMKKSDEKLAKSDGKKAAYGTDPEVAAEINKRFLAAHGKITASITNDPKMKRSEKIKRLADLKRKKDYFADGVRLANHVQNIKNMPADHPALPKVYISDKNKKLKKDGIWSFNLPAGHTCPGKGDCFGYCYAMIGPQSWTNSLRVRHNNFGLAERDDFVPKMNEALKGVSDRIRVHDSGDFYSQDYVNKWAEIAKANPHKKFYAYTKALHLNLDPLHSLPNFNIIQSVGSNQDHKIDTTKPHAFIFPSHQAREAAGYINSSDSDLPSMDKKNTKIGLVVHGGRAAQYDSEKHGDAVSHKDINESNDSDWPIYPMAKSSGRYHLAGGEIPDVHKFDQIDAPHQLAQSSHPVDQMKALRLKTSEGSYSSAFDNKIKDIKAMYMAANKPTIAERIEEIKAKHRTPATPTLAQQIQKMKTKYKDSLIKNEDESSSDKLTKGSMIRGSLADTFPKTYEALVMDGDGDDHSVMRHHMQMHHDSALKATNPADIRHHWENVNKIHNHLASLHKAQDVSSLLSSPKVSMPSADMTQGKPAPTQTTSALPTKAAPVNGVIK